MTDPQRRWPRRTAKGAFDAETYFDRRRKETLDALDDPASEPQAVAATARWLEQASTEGRRLPQRDTFGAELADALRDAGLHEQADRIAPGGEPDDDVIDVSTDAAVLAARAAVGAFEHRTDLDHWRTVQRLGGRTDRLETATARCLELSFRSSAAFAERVGALADTVALDIVARSPRAAAPGAEGPSDAVELLDVWFDMRHGHEPLHRSEDFELLALLASLDPVRFMATIAGFPSPFDVKSALDSTRAAVEFETWAALVVAAPAAFEDDGAWNGSVILPLLLVTASSTIDRVSLVGNRDIPEDEIEAANEALGDAATMVADVLWTRVDAGAAAWRWSAWLLRSMMMAATRGRSVPMDSRDPGYGAWVLAGAVAAVAKDRRAWAVFEAATVADEEAWFATMGKVLATPQDASGSNDHAAILADLMTSFPQDDAPEGWLAAEGERLRSASRVVRTFATRPCTLGVRLLAIPLTLTGDPVSGWRSVWRRCLVLREAVEFEDLQSAPGNGRDPQAAAGILRLVVDVGLCVIDQLLDPRLTTPSDKALSAGALALLLWEATGEMLALDRFGTDEWNALRRHLVMRMATHPHGFRRQPGAPVLDAAAMLARLAGPTRSFLTVLRTLLSAGVTPAGLATLLETADVDLDALLDVVDRLNVMDPRRPIASVTELGRLREVAALQEPSRSVRTSRAAALDRPNKKSSLTSKR